MELPTSPHIVEALQRRAGHPTYGYTYQPEVMWAAVANWLRQYHGWSVHPSQFVFAPSVVTSFSLALRALTQPGDRVLLMTPLYEPLQHAVTGLGRSLIRFPLREGANLAGIKPAEEETLEDERELQLDLEGRLEPLLPTTKLVLLCSPHNPAGRVWQRSELVALAAACARYGVILVEDAIWADWCLWGETFVPFASAAAEAKQATGVECRHVCLGAPSKTWNLGGLHASWVYFSDDMLRHAYLAEAEPATLTFGSTFATEAMLAAYNHGMPWLLEAKAYVEANLLYVTSELREHVPEITPLMPRATYLLWLDCSGLGFGCAADLHRFMIEEAQLLLSPGASFAPGTTARYFNTAFIFTHLPRRFRESRRHQVI